MITQFEHGTLPLQQEWNAHIDALAHKTVPTTQEDVKRALIAAVKKRIPAGHFGVFLSGGVDSTLLACILKHFTTNFTCYSVGIEGSSDLSAAQEAARHLGLPLKHATYTPEEIQRFFSTTKKLMTAPTVTNVSIGSVIVAAAQLAAQDNVTTFFGGLGSEDIFAGYHRHTLAHDVNAECWHGLKTTWERDFTRDSAVANALGITVLVPYLDDEVILAGMGIPGDHKVQNGERKVVLRKIAEELGVPHTIAWRKKIAAQYGSGFDKVMEKLAKEQGTIKGKYITTL